MKIKTIALLGSTGSIGDSVLEIVKKTKKLKVVLIFANSNYIKIQKQIKFFKPRIVIVSDYEVYLRVKKKNKTKKLFVLNNTLNLNKYIKKIDISVSAIPGIKGLEPTITFVKLSKKMLLANKESIVCGWTLIKKEALKHRTKLVPIDSEHFSISELIKNHTNEEINRIYITASGGPFLKVNRNKFNLIKPKDAIKHPKWKMGKKISVDSATLMNKVLELIEALKLFSFDLNKYKILIHPQSLVHAIVEFKNGTTFFLYHQPDMKIPISNAMFDGKLVYSKYFKSVSPKNISNLNLDFSPVDMEKFSTLKLIPKICESESGAIIVNAANEIFVEQFLKNNIQFNHIFTYLNLVLKDKNYIKTSIMPSNNIKNIYNIDGWARETALKIIKQEKRNN